MIKKFPFSKMVWISLIKKVDSILMTGNQRDHFISETHGVSEVRNIVRSIDLIS